MKVSQKVVELFDSENIEQVFTLMSDGIMGLVSDVINEEKIDVVQTRHEQSAVAMADGYSRANGDIGVSLVGRGPALAQTGTALGTAANQGSDVLILAAECPYSTPDNSLQHKPKTKKFDQHGYLKNILGEKHVFDIRSEAAVIPDLEEVFRRLRVGEGPIAVQIPHDIFERDIDISRSVGGKGDAVLENNAPTIRPPDKKIESAVEHYLDSDPARPPIVLAGHGAADSGAKDSIEAFAEQINGLLSTSKKARGLFSDHPYSLGFAGGWGSNIANQYIADSDCIFAFGCSLNPYTLDGGRILPNGATVIHVDTDPASIGRYAPIDVGVVGGAKETAEMLLAKLEAMNIDHSGSFWTDSLRREISEAPDFEEREYPERDGLFDPRILVNHLNEILPAKRFIVSDGGHSSRWAIHGLDITHPDDCTWSVNFAAVGQAMSQGIGASMSLDNDRTCITSCGDAGFLMHLSEVETAARNDVPMIIIVWNDDGYGEEYHNLVDVGRDPDGAVVSTPDLSEVAEKLGADGYQISDKSDLKRISNKIRKKPDGPVVLDCRIDVDVRHRSAGLH